MKHRHASSRQSVTLASRSLGTRVTPKDGEVNGLTFLSPRYARGLDIVEPSAPMGFDGEVRDPMGYITGKAGRDGNGKAHKE